MFYVNIRRERYVTPANRNSFFRTFIHLIYSIEIDFNKILRKINSVIKIYVKKKRLYIFFFHFCTYNIILYYIVYPCDVQKYCCKPKGGLLYKLIVTLIGKQLLSKTDPSML